MKFLTTNKILNLTILNHGPNTTESTTAMQNANDSLARAVAEMRDAAESTRECNHTVQGTLRAERLENWADRIAALTAQAWDWVIVPREMTDAMVEAFMSGSGFVRMAWKQAIAAAPHPQAVRPSPEGWVAAIDTEALLSRACAAFSRMQGRQSFGPGSDTYAQFRAAMRSAIAEVLAAAKPSAPAVGGERQYQWQHIGLYWIDCSEADAKHRADCGNKTRVVYINHEAAKPSSEAGGE